MSEQENSPQLTVLLNQWIGGDKSIENDLIRQVYPLLRDVAHQQLRKNYNSNMHTTLIVNELYLKLKNQKRVRLNDKNHFLALSAHLVRQVIIDNIRSQKAIKRGALYQQVTFNDTVNAQGVINNLQMNVDWLTLDRLLNELEKVDPVSVKLIELRFFVGLNLKEVAEIQGISVATITRNWQFAKSWLLNKLQQ